VRILLVEDDGPLGDGIRAGLKLADYAVDWVRDGEAARLALLDHAYQACVLDLGCPGAAASVLAENCGKAADICRC
jgi:DNA-binding response OmpR family regulator